MVALSSGDWLKIAPAAKRQFFAGEDSGRTFVCIQVKENSLGGFRQTTQLCIEWRHGEHSRLASLIGASF